MPALPIEIIEYMIDYLSDDSAALKACSLTCRSWSPRARNNLFTKLRVNPYPSSQLQSLPTASIPFHAVRVMTIIGSSVKLSALLEPHWSTLQNLTDLRIRGFLPARDAILDNYLLSFLVNFPTLESLTIWDCQLLTSTTIIHIIQNLPQLSRLELRRIAIKSPEYIAPLPDRTSPLRHLYINQLDGSIQKFIENLLVPELSLHLWSCYVSYANVSHALIEGSAMSLRTLDARSHSELAFLANDSCC
jgi:hypothetical protein